MFFECDFVSGWTSGMASLVVGHPFDTIKVRQQTFKENKIIPVVLNTYKNDGMRGFYRGLLFPMLTSGVYNSLYFCTYGFAMRILEREYSDDPKHRARKFCCEPGPITKSFHTSVATAGAIGGGVAIIVGCPIELIKIQLQVMSAGTKESYGMKKVTGPISCAKAIYEVGGLRALYKGAIPLLVRDIPSFGLYMLTYEHLVCKFEGAMKQDQQPRRIHELLAGGAAGTISWVTLMPVDVVKSRIQADDIKSPKYKGMMDCITKSYRNDGIAIFMRGFVACALRAFPANAAAFYVYQLSIDNCEDMFTQ